MRKPITTKKTTMMGVSRGSFPDRFACCCECYTLCHIAIPTNAVASKSSATVHRQESTSNTPLHSVPCCHTECRMNSSNTHTAFSFWMANRKRCWDDVLHCNRSISTLLITADRFPIN